MANFSTHGCWLINVCFQCSDYPHQPIQTHKYHATPLPHTLYVFALFLSIFLCICLYACWSPSLHPLSISLSLSLSLFLSIYFSLSLPLSYTHTRTYPITCCLLLVFCDHSNRCEVSTVMHSGAPGLDKLYTVMKYRVAVQPPCLSHCKNMDEMK